MDEKVFIKLEYDRIRERLSDFAVSDLGKKACTKLIPETDPEAINKLLEETSEAEHITLTAVSYPLVGFDDVTDEISRLKLGASLSCGELLRVNRLEKAAKRAKQGIGRAEAEVLKQRSEDLYFDDEVIERIDEAIISPDEVADNASRELRDIRRKIRSENAAIRDKLNELIRSKEKSMYLQDSLVTLRDGRYVVPVKQEYRSNVPGLVQGQSSSGATVFIEPMAIVEANNKLKILEEEERREIERILAELSRLAAGGAEGLKYDIDIMTELDVIFAKARLSVEMKAYRPIMSGDRTVRIRKGRHPLIDPKTVIPVDIEVSSDINTLIITGPNTGGKTVTLKLIGLFSLMAQSGLFLPAGEGSMLPIYDSVYADIGDEQSIEQSLSTFSSHMKKTIDILNDAGEDSLVLLDELGAGTDPEEGTAIALAVLKELTDRRTRVFATTHYSQIKVYAMSEPHYENASMEFDANSLRPTFRMIMGIAGSSNAFLVSKRLGLDDYILESARSFMNQDRLEFDDMMLEAEKTRKAADDRMRAAVEIGTKAEETEKRIRELEKELDQKKESILAKARQEAYEIIKKTSEEAEEIIKEARKTRHQTEREATKSVEGIRAELAVRKDQLKKQVDEDSRENSAYKKIDVRNLKKGDDVYIASLGVNGIVQTLPDAKGIVKVQAGIMTMNISVEDLREKKEEKKRYERTSSVRMERKTIPMSIDLYGLTVDDAIVKADKYLDDAYIAGLKEVTLVHGKGTGALRKGLHEYLRHRNHVESFRVGKYGEGEEGVTIVRLK